MTNKRIKGTKDYVEDILKEHPEWNASQVYDRYKLLIGDINKAVGLSAVQKQVESIRPVLAQMKMKGLHIPWSLGAGAKHNISPEANLHLLKLTQEYELDGEKITIRVAIWFSRLLPSFQEYYPMPDLTEAERYLYWLVYVKTYANMEYVHDFKDIQNKRQTIFDTRKLDRLIFKEKKEIDLTSGNYIGEYLEAIDVETYEAQKHEVK